MFNIFNSATTLSPDFNNIIFYLELVACISAANNVAANPMTAMTVITAYFVFIFIFVLCLVLQIYDALVPPNVQSSGTRDG